MIEKRKNPINKNRENLVKTLQGEPQKIEPSVTLEASLLQDENFEIGEKVKLSLETEVSGINQAEKGSTVSFTIKGVAVNSNRKTKQEITPTEELE
jgi:hypothetical protein